MAVFSFCPNRLVPETLPPERPKGMSFNGWSFTSRPTTPFQRRFKLTLYGLQWYLAPNGLYDATTNVNFNAHALELFYRDHEIWRPFDWTHPHFGPMVCKFDAPVIVPAAMPNSNGLIESMEIQMVHDNPGY